MLKVHRHWKLRFVDIIFYFRNFCVFHIQWTLQKSKTIRITENTVPSSAYREYCTEFSLQRILYRVQLTENTVQSSAYREYCTEFSLQRILYRVLLIENTVPSSAHREYCTEFSLQRILYRVQLGWFIYKIYKIVIIKIFWNLAS